MNNYTGAKRRQHQAEASFPFVKVSVARSGLVVASVAPLLALGMWLVTKPRHKRIKVEDLRKAGL